MVIVTVGERYAIDERLGEGGMGCVYRARHVHLNKQFALKLISPANALDEVVRQRFNEEAKLASEISHPNIVSVVDFGEDPQFGAYMVMELVEGVALPKALPMPQRRALEVLCQVCDALSHIHGRGIIHGDVKAENIMLVEVPDGARRKVTARLLDFGLARRRTPDPEVEATDPEGPVTGSPHYMAPERIVSGTMTIESDIYALGVLAYLLVAGSLPFEGNLKRVLQAHADDRPVSPTAKREGIPVRSIDNLIARAMSKDPTLRHPSVDAFRYELNTVMDMLDMSPRRRTSQNLRPLQVRDALQIAVFQASPVAQALLDGKGTIVVANQALSILVERDPLDGVSIAETSLCEALPELPARIEATAADGRHRELAARIERDDGVEIELAVWLVPLALGTGQVLALVRVTEVQRPPAVPVVS